MGKSVAERWRLMLSGMVVDLGRAAGADRVRSIC
jgi:hypothetical protein